MPSLEEGLVTHLQAQAGLTALVGQRIYPEILPQDVVYPAIRYARVGVLRGLMLDGVNTLTEVRIQIDVWGATYAAVKAIGAQLRLALDGVTGNMGGVSVFIGRYDNEVDLSDLEIEGDMRDRRMSYDFVFTLHE